VAQFNPLEDDTYTLEVVDAGNNNALVDDLTVDHSQAKK